MMLTIGFQPLVADLGRLDNEGRQDGPRDWGRKGLVNEKNFQRHYLVRVF